jgi:hypothetical protein
MIKRFNKTFVFIYSIILLAACNEYHNNMITSEDGMIEQFISAQQNILRIENINGIHHAIINEGDNLNPVQQGDSVYFYFDAYYLASSSNMVLFETNNKTTAEEHGLDTNSRNFDIKGEIAGSGKLVAGLDKGLMLCNLNEECFLIFNSDLGYGSAQLGIIPPYSPIVFRVLIVRLEK